MVAAKTGRLGPFEIVDQLGAGGMARVFKALYAPLESVSTGDAFEQLARNDVVALKIANRVVVNEPILARRFHNEYKLTRKLRHSNIVRTLGYGVAREMPFLVMEYVPGQNLAKRLQERGPSPMGEALNLIQEVAKAIGFMHRNHLVHRDIHPGNILINTAGHAKIADLGLMKDLESDALLTHSNVGLGTLAYAAPEQFDDAKHSGHRCDVYGLAATLYHILTGGLPFGTGSLMQVVKRKLEHRLVPISRIISNVSLALDQAVIRALHPDPFVRPATVEEFMEGVLGKVSTQPIPVPSDFDRPVPVGQGGRAHVRYPIDLVTTLHDESAPTETLLPANIVDVSLGGLCLRTPRRFDIDAELTLNLPNEYAGLAGNSSNHRVRIRWIKKLPRQGWLFGCSFLQTLSDEELERFLLLGQARTMYFQHAAAVEYAA